MDKTKRAGVARVMVNTETGERKTVYAHFSKERLRAAICLKPVRGKKGGFKIWVVCPQCCLDISGRVPNFEVIGKPDQGALSVPESDRPALPCSECGELLAWED